MRALPSRASLRSFTSPGVAVSTATAFFAGAFLAGAFFAGAFATGAFAASGAAARPASWGELFRGENAAYTLMVMMGVMAREATVPAAAAPA